MFPAVVHLLSVLLASALLVAGQTSTSCSPLNTTCPSDKGLTSQTFSTDFTKGQNSSWIAANYTTITYSDLGAAFTVNTKNDAPTIETDFYIFFGYVEVKARAANGTGIVSSIVLQSDDLDEVDWEFLGGNDAAIQTNFFGKGNTTTYNRMTSVAVNKATETFHTYALNWTSSSLTWLIDGVAVRTLKYTDDVALNGKNYPQTPCRLKLGIWAGGASSNEGTVEWAGGATDFSDAPFTMYVDSVKITNYNPASSYTYSDKSGDFTSIKLDNSTSTSSNSTSVSPVGETSTSAASTITPRSSVGASSAGSRTTAASTPVASFVQGSNGAGRQVDDSSVEFKVVYAAMILYGLLLA